MHRFALPPTDLRAISANQISGLNRLFLFEGILGRVPLEKKRPAYQIVR
jgi:hypothetical protein